jgi:hypothetical protein
MTTFLDVRTRVADQLARSDLDTQIEREIQLAIARYNRRVSWLHEVREVSLTSVALQPWYDAVDVSTGAGPQDVTGRTSVPVTDIQKIEYMRDPDYEDLRQVHYREFERFFDTTGASGRPTYFTLYAGQVGIWPVPDGVTAYTLSAVVKPVVPASAADESVWFDQAQELIENAAAAAICRKFIQDGERAQAFQVYEAAAWEDLVKEGNQKMATGRLRACD